MRHYDAWLSSVALTLFLTGSAAGQEFRGTILGTITDTSGGLIAGAMVTATRKDKNVTSKTLTAANETYTVPFVVPGAYRVTVEAAGLKALVREGIEVQVQQRVRLDFELEPGMVTETINVTAEAPLLESTSASVGEALGRRQVIDQVIDLPQNGRNPYLIARMALGVMATDTRTFTRPFDNGGTSRISINGAPSASNDFLLHGIPNASPGNTIAFVPSVEAVSEMKVQTNTYDAEFGRAAGGTVNVTVRSGTNDFHGSLHEFWRRVRLSARGVEIFRTGKPGEIERSIDLG